MLQLTTSLSFVANSPWVQMSCRVFSLQHKHILFDQELLADRIAVLCPQTISKILGICSELMMRIWNEFWEWILNIIDRVSVAQYASVLLLHVSQSQGLQSLLDVSVCGINPSLVSSQYWPMTGLDCHKLANQAPDNCLTGRRPRWLLLCRVSESVQYQVDVPAPL